MKNLLITAVGGALLLISSQGMAGNIEAGKKKRLKSARLATAPMAIVPPRRFPSLPDNMPAIWKRP